MATIPRATKANSERRSTLNPGTLKSLAPFEPEVCSRAAGSNEAALAGFQTFRQWQVNLKKFLRRPKASGCLLQGDRRTVQFEARFPLPSPFHVEHARFAKPPGAVLDVASTSSYLNLSVDAVLQAKRSSNSHEFTDRTLRKALCTRSRAGAANAEACRCRRHSCSCVSLQLE